MSDWKYIRIFFSSKACQILEKIDTSFSKYAQEDFSEAKEMLFGENFQVTLSDKAEKEATLAKAVAASKCSKQVRERIHRVTAGRITIVTNSFSKEPCCQVWGQTGQELPTVQLRKEQRESPPTRAIPLNHTEKHSLVISRIKLPMSESASKPVQEINTPRLPRSSGLLNL